MGILIKLLYKILGISIANIIDCTIQNLRLWKPYPSFDKETFSPSNEVWTEKNDPATKEITWEPNVESSSKSFIKYVDSVSTNPSSGFLDYSHRFYCCYMNSIIINSGKILTI